jgi:hypothetical protein
LEDVVAGVSFCRPVVNVARSESLPNLADRLTQRDDLSFYEVRLASPVTVYDLPTIVTSGSLTRTPFAGRNE